MGNRAAAVFGVAVALLAAAGGCAGSGARRGAAEAGAGGRLDPRTGVTFVLVPGGEFSPGLEYFLAPGEPPPRALVGSFWMARSELTVGQFRRFARATGYRSEAERAAQCLSYGPWEGYQEVFGRSWRDPGYEVGDDHPAAFLTWNDAIAYCAWAGCRLPTELEWEYAAGNGARDTNFSWGDGAPPDGRRAGNVADLAARRIFGWEWAGGFEFGDFDDGHGYPTPVCSYAPNDFGLCDMTGNLAEHTGGAFREEMITEALDDLIADLNGSAVRVVKGGGWDAGMRHFWIAGRFRAGSHRCDGATGFRPVVDALPALR